MSKRPPHTYRLTLTDEHLRVLMRAADFASRIACGQFREVVEVADPQYRVTREARVEAEKMLTGARRQLMPGLQGEHSSWGIHSDKVNDSARVLYDLVQVVRHRLAWDANPKGSWTVDFDEPRRASTTLSLAEIEAVTKSKRPSVAKRRQKTTGADE